MSKAETVLDATPNVGTRNRTDSDSGSSVTDCRVNSFDPGTEVLMADGSHERIEDVELGDQVWAVDPESGVSGPRPVTALIEGYGTKQLVDVTVDGYTVVATDEHPFWVVDGDSGAWVDAEDLKAGDVLLTPDGVTRVDDVGLRLEQDHTVHNLTVADLHTFHVAFGNHDVLTHNTNCEQLELFDGRDYDRAGPASVTPEYRGSTGPTTPHSLNEQLAMSEVRSAPGGAPLDLPMSDPRWPAATGWRKYQQIVNGTNVHYVSDGTRFDDFKFKYDPPRARSGGQQMRLF